MLLNFKRYWIVPFLLCIAVSSAECAAVTSLEEDEGPVAKKSRVDCPQNASVLSFPFDNEGVVESAHLAGLRILVNDKSSLIGRRLEKRVHPLFMLPKGKAHESYTHGLSYMVARNFSIVTVLLRSLKLNELQYGVVQRSYFLYICDEKKRLIQKLNITYPNGFSWDLEVWVSQNELEFIHVGKKDRRGVLFVDKREALVYQTPTKKTTCADQATHLYYDDDFCRFACCLKGGGSVPLEWCANGDSIILQCNGVKIDEFFEKNAPVDVEKQSTASSLRGLLGGKKRPQEENYTVKSFLKTILPSLPGYKSPYIHLRADRTSIEVAFVSSNKVWLVGYSLEEQSGWIKNGWGLRNIRYSLPFTNPTSCTGVCLNLTMGTSFARCVFSKYGESVCNVFDRSNTKVSNGITTLETSKCVLPVYHVGGSVESIILSTDGYVRFVENDKSKGFSLRACQYIYPVLQTIASCLSESALSQPHCALEAPLAPKTKHKTHPIQRVQRQIYCKNERGDKVAKMIVYPNIRHPGKLRFDFQIAGQTVDRFSVLCQEKGKAVWLTYDAPVALLHIYQSSKYQKRLSAVIQKDNSPFGQNKLLVKLGGRAICSLRVRYRPYHKDVAWLCWLNFRSAVGHEALSRVFDL